MLFCRSGNAKLQESASVLTTSLSAIQPPKKDYEYENDDQVDDHERSTLDRSCASSSLAVTKEAMPESVLITAATVDTATHSSSIPNAVHQQSSSDASVTYITYDAANVTSLQQQQQQIKTEMQPILQLESLKVGAAKAKPWVVFLLCKI